MQSQEVYHDEAVGVLSDSQDRSFEVLGAIGTRNLNWFGNGP